MAGDASSAAMARSRPCARVAGEQASFIRQYAHLLELVNPIAGVNTIFSKFERKTANFRQKHNKAACPISLSRHLALALIG
jgi:hypothetical protein